jgi:hypothetical protein
MNYLSADSLKLNIAEPAKITVNRAEMSNMEG